MTRIQVTAHLHDDGLIRSVWDGRTKKACGVKTYLRKLEYRYSLFGEPFAEGETIYNGWLDSSEVAAAFAVGDTYFAAYGRAIAALKEVYATRFWESCPIQPHPDEIAYREEFEAKRRDVSENR